jgi:hypothetical protein
MDTLETDLGKQMKNLIDEYGITVVTTALINEVENRENWKQIETLHEVLSGYIAKR